MTGTYQSDPVAIKGGMRALIASADASAGHLIPPDRRGVVAPGLLRPLTIRNLVSVQPTTSDRVEYVREASRVSAAAPVTAPTQVAHTGDTTATKPEGGLAFAVETADVQTFALWTPAARKVVSNAAALRAYVDRYLTDDIKLELEDQMISGTAALGARGSSTLPGRRRSVRQLVASRSST